MPNMHMLIVDPIIADIPGIKLLEASYFFPLPKPLTLNLAELQHKDSDADLLVINLPDSDELRLARPDASVAAVTYPI